MSERSSTRSRPALLPALLLAGLSLTLPAPSAADEAADSPSELSPPSAADGDSSPAEPAVPQSLLLRFLADPSTFTLLDARSPEEYAESHIDGAVNVPHDRLDRHGDALPASLDETVVVYCRTGRRAGRLKAQLAERGYSDVRVLQPEQIFSGDGLMVFNCAAATPMSKPLVGTKSAAVDAREKETER